MMLKIKFYIIFSIFSQSGYCQVANLPEVIVNIAEDLAGSDSDDEAAASYTDRLYELAENPVDLNSGSEKEISRLFFLSDFQVKALADYTLSSGKIVSFNELALIPGFDRATAEMIMPFCSITSKENTINDSIRIKNHILTNMTLRKGKEDSISPGSAWRVLTKYKFSAGSFTGGITLEKDPGEKFFCPGTVSPDFFSANIAYTGKGFVKRVILGDYSARFGQGLNTNTSTSTGLSMTSPGYMSASNEIKPYTSTDENIFFRGIAAVLSFKDLELSLLCSKNSLDATLGTSSGNSADYIQSFYKSGTHNTPLLLQKKDVVSESVYEINLAYNFRFLKTGATYSKDIFSLPLKPDAGNPEKAFSFSGSSVNVFSLYYNSMAGRLLLYGEVSANDIRRYAIVQGLAVRPSDRLTVNFLFRKYNEGYTSFHGKGPGNSTFSYPEQSVTGNFTFEAARHLFISGGCGIRNFPWLKYRCSSPSREVKREIRIRYLPADKLTFEGLYSYRFSMSDDTAINRVPELKQMTFRSLKLLIRYSAGDNLTFGTRIDYKFAGSGGSRGVLLLEDLNFSPRTIPLTFWTRYCIFNTDDYDSRIYTFENDLLYSFSIPALYGKGSRFYIMAGWKITDKAELRFKYGILSGSTRTESFTDTEEFRLQIKLFIR